MRKPPPPPLSRGWRVFLLAAFFVGAALRLLHPEDMEFKEDEWFNFIQTRSIGISRPWPWIGMPSGVYIPNPGMSIWVFVWLARLFQVTSPIGLARALQCVSLLGILLILPFLRHCLERDEHQEREREPWLWAFALAMVNPFLIYLHRKLWPEPFFTVFTMLTLMAWWKRRTLAGAFMWGLLGACLGQIHMSGFFFAAGLALWTAFLERRDLRWLKGWLVGSALGALPLVPWALSVLHAPPLGGPVSHGWEEIAQLKFWVFWITDPLGFHLGNPLGLLRGQSHWAQLSDFVRYPLYHGQATYLNAAAHAAVLIAAVGIFGPALLRRLRRRTSWKGWRSPTAFVESSAIWGFGLLMTLTGINIRRYYMAVSFPLELTWVARLALAGNGGRGRRLLFLLWLAQVVIAACFVNYVHTNQGAPQGDYGAAYHVVVEHNLKVTGKPWEGAETSAAP